MELIFTAVFALFCFPKTSFLRGTLCGRVVIVHGHRALSLSPLSLSLSLSLSHGYPTAGPNPLRVNITSYSFVLWSFLFALKLLLKWFSPIANSVHVCPDV